jgi:Ala-tRNA(Pro) deacylase
MNSAYDTLIEMLTANGATFRLIDHPPEGRTEVVSGYRGHPVGDAAKCMILIVKIGKKTTRYVLAVVPGDKRVDFSAIKALLGGTYVGVASQETAETLAKTVAGTVLPFTLDAALELIADRSLATRETLYFNAARLDRSVAIAAADYLRIAKPRLEAIAT